jgi:uncharacterized protein (DUF58 family)
MPTALVEGLELPLARRGARTFPGDRRAPSTGAGTELARLRAYQPGDDVRHLDAAASARTGVAHVRLHVPERTLTTWVVIDLSPSMAFGSTLRLKADVAEGAALVLGRLAVKRGGGLALVSFGSSAPRVLPPRSSRPALIAMRRVLGEGVAPDGHSEPSGLAHALERVGRLARAPGLVAVISDFRDQDDWSRPMGSLTGHHAVLAIEITDPRERELPAVGRLAVVDPETGRRIEIDTSRRRIRERFASLERERREQLTRELRRLRVEQLSLSTAGDWLAEMGRGLR